MAWWEKVIMSDNISSSQEFLFYDNKHVFPGSLDTLYGEILSFSAKISFCFFPSPPSPYLSREKTNFHRPSSTKVRKTTWRLSLHTHDTTRGDNYKSLSSNLTFYWNHIRSDEMKSRKSTRWGGGGGREKLKNFFPFEFFFIAQLIAVNFAPVVKEREERAMCVREVDR